MKVKMGLDLKIKCKSVGLDNIKVISDKLYSYREILNDKGYKVVELEGNMLSITIPMLYSIHNGNNIRVKNTSKVLTDIKNLLDNAGLRDFDLENAKSKSVEVNCNFDTKKIDPSLIVTYIAKVLEFYNEDGNNKTNRACRVIKPDKEDLLADNYCVTDSILHKEGDFSFKIYNKSKQLKDLKNIELNKNILRIEIKFKGSYLGKTSVGNDIENVLGGFDKLTELYMRHTKYKLVSKLIDFQSKLEDAIVKRLSDGEGLTDIYRSYKYYIVDGRILENAIFTYMDNIGVKEAKTEAKKKVNILKQKNEELKVLTGSQKILEEIIKYFE